MANKGLVGQLLGGLGRGAEMVGESYLSEQREERLMKSRAKIGTEATQESRKYEEGKAEKLATAKVEASSVEHTRDIAMQRLKNKSGKGLNQNSVKSTIDLGEGRVAVVTKNNAMTIYNTDPDDPTKIGVEWTGSQAEYKEKGQADQKEAQASTALAEKVESMYDKFNVDDPESGIGWFFKSRPDFMDKAAERLGGELAIKAVIGNFLRGNPKADEFAVIKAINAADKDDAAIVEESTTPAATPEPISEEDQKIVAGLPAPTENMEGKTATYKDPDDGSTTSVQVRNGVWGKIVDEKWVKLTK